MTRRFNYPKDYLDLLRLIKEMLIPFETQMDVLASQEDSYCLYFPKKAGRPQMLFASAQIRSRGVSFQVYLPPTDSGFRIEPELFAFQVGRGTFLFKKASPELMDCISKLMITSLQEYYKEQFS